MEFRRHIKFALFVVSALHLEYQGDWRFYLILYVIGDCIALFDIWQIFCNIDYCVVLPHRAMLIMFWSLADEFWGTRGV